jgi:AraC family transcriptional regulator, transcriptional activator of pobA
MRLPLDRIESGAPVEVVPLVDFGIVGRPVRDPHRHDYHELIWLREGEGEHLIDDRVLPVETGAVTIIGRGQVHVFRRAVGLHGGILRFTDEVIQGRTERIAAAWLLSGPGGRAVPVPADEQHSTEALLQALWRETQHSPDTYSAEVERHLVSTLLLWLERWHDAADPERRESDPAEVQLHRRFVERLERDFATHHDAAHYADALAVAGPALSRALTARTGRATKELVTERVMLEAVRLLRYTDLSVGEIARRVGFDDPLYFSRAFKRHAGEAPLTYREAARGRDA